MKKILISIFIIWLLSICAFAQTEKSQKLDEFGTTNCCDYLARMDNLLIELDKSPNAKGYVFVYEGDIEKRIYDESGKYKNSEFVPSQKGLAKDIIGYFKKQLLMRKFPNDRVVFVEAGFREKFVIELWFVPNGAEPPKPSPTLKKIKQKKREKSEFGFCEEI